MPALANVQFCARVSFRGTANGVAIVNVFHVAWGGEPLTISEAVSLCTGVRTAYEANFVPRLASTWSGDTCRVVDLTNADGVEATQALGGTTGGSGTSMPQSTACCVTWKIDRHYRGGHPRTYLGPLPNTAIESPTSLAAAYITQVAGSANAFKNAVNALTAGTKAFRLVCVHRQVNGVQVIVPIKSDIQSVVVDSRIDTMRRRLGPDR